MSRERIEGIKNRIDPNKWRDGLHLNIKEEIEWLIEQAELAQVFSKKNVELNKFLQGVSSPKNLGRNVVDVAMDMIREQSERIEQMEMKYENTGAMFSRQNMLGRIELLEEENKLYCKALVFATEELMTILEVENLTKEQIEGCAGSAYIKINETLEAME